MPCSAMQEGIRPDLTSGGDEKAHEKPSRWFAGVERTEHSMQGVGIPAPLPPIRFPYVEFLVVALLNIVLLSVVVNSCAHRLFIAAISLVGCVSLVNMRVAANRGIEQRYLEMLYRRYDLSPLG